MEFFVNCKYLKISEMEIKTGWNKVSFRVQLGLSGVGGTVDKLYGLNLRISISITS